MKLQIQTQSLTDALETLRPIYSSRTTLPCLSNVRLLAKSGKLTISANNLDLYGEVSADGEVSAEGEVALVGIRLLNAVKNATTENVQMEVKDGSLFFTAGRSKIRMSGLPIEELPEIPKCEATSSCIVMASDLSKALEETLPFVSFDKTRFTLNGVFFDGDKEELRLVAVDGRALSKRAIEVPSKDVTAIIPTASCGLLKSLCGEIKLTFDANKFCADTGDVKLIGKIIEGSFPNWRNVVPSRKEQVVSATVDRKELLSILPKFYVFGIDGLGSPYIYMTIGANSLEIEGSSETSDASDEVPAKVKGGGFKIGLDVKYLQNILNSYETEEITLLFSEPINPMLVECGSGQSVQMSIRVKSK